MPKPITHLGNLGLKVCLTATWQLAQTHVTRKDLYFSLLYTLIWLPLGLSWWPIVFLLKWWWNGIALPASDGSWNDADLNGKKSAVVFKRWWWQTSTSEKLNKNWRVTWITNNHAVTKVLWLRIFKAEAFGFSSKKNLRFACLCEWTYIITPTNRHSIALTKLNLVRVVRLINVCKDEK